MLSIPNMFTFSRIALIPFFVLVFYVPGPYSNYAAAIIFLIAALTDWIDGFLARKLQQTSKFGAFLDPVADKLLVACALVLIAVEFRNFWITIPAIVIVCREIAVSALREWMAEVGQRTRVKVSVWGKIKTVFQLVAVIILISQPPDWNIPLVWLGVFLMYSAVLLTIWSMVEYLRAALVTLR
ncbi:MAG TPA: CDP-diacylglycerol--glycerol-3-phosphate 3-phosphatidyltransferase [Gammaproteobacteria bacterium]|nr:CDP-diacylglycerol--glycerol-3-phosphate 3-phosphatidyltransferase [Gammaproteobacteria bacterium]